MVGAVEFSPVINALYAAVAEPVQWQAALESVTDLLNGAHTILWMGRERIEEVTGLLTARVDDREVVRRLAGYVEDEDAISFPNLPVGRALTRSALVTDEAYAKSAQYNEIVRYIGGFHGLSLRNQAFGSSYVVNCCRARPAGDFDYDEVARLQMLAPHLMTVMTLRQRFSAIEGERAVLASVLDSMATALILIDAAGKPVLINAAAARIVTEADGLSLRGDGRAAGDPIATRRLREAVAAVSLDTAVEGRRLRIERPSSRRPLVLTVLPAWRLGLNVPGTTSPRAAIFINDLAAPALIDREAVAEAFGLTPRESDVAALLAEGLAPQAIAKSLGLGRGTVAFHLKRVFGKTDTHSQAALVALIHNSVMARPGA
jgi:DNA-binding CsgD family transcriptional regulator/PAS domain-containing protein